MSLFSRRRRRSFPPTPDLASRGHRPYLSSTLPSLPASPPPINARLTPLGPPSPPPSPAALRPDLYVAAGSSRAYEERPRAPEGAWPGPEAPLRRRLFPWLVGSGPARVALGSVPHVARLARSPPAAMSPVRAVLALLAALWAPAAGYFVSIDAHAEECFLERVPSGTKMGLIFEVAEGGFLDIDVEASPRESRAAGVWGKGQGASERVQSAGLCALAAWEGYGGGLFFASPHV